MHVTFPVEVTPECPFPITNIPFGIFNTKESPARRVGTAIGDYVLDLSYLEGQGVFLDCFARNENETADRNGPRYNISIFGQINLNSFASIPAVKRTCVRKKIIEILQDEHSILFSNERVNSSAFYKQNEAQMHLPMRIGDFTDFMCSRTHVDNCSRMAGASTPPSFYAMPTAYNGRASSVVISGTSVPRPRGMLRIPGSSNFEFGPSQRMDYELEMGFYVSKPVPFGSIIKTADEAKEHIFGFVMLNDWSARDIQFAEMTPLGPFNGKGSATTTSPWIVTLDALEGAEVSISDDMAQEKMTELPLHLRHQTAKQTWNIGVEVAVKKATHERPVTIAISNLSDLYWSPAQMLSHHASSGCGLRTGDLLGTGTISSPERGSASTVSLGCLHETTAAGTKPFTMSNNGSLTWIEDGDEVLMTGKVMVSDGSIIGFGECKGQLEPCHVE